MGNQTKARKPFPLFPSLTEQGETGQVFPKSTLQIVVHMQSQKNMTNLQDFSVWSIVTHCCLNEYF